MIAIAPLLASVAGDTDDVGKLYSKFVEEKGWLGDYKRGKEIISSLSHLSAEELKKIDIARYCGENVAFVGRGAGATNDLVTEEGFYLRVVNPKGKDLRPHSVSWGVLVHGRVLQVLAQNKIILIEVRDKDWIVLITT